MQNGVSSFYGNRRTALLSQRVIPHMLSKGNYSLLRMSSPCHRDTQAHRLNRTNQDGSKKRMAQILLITKAFVTLQDVKNLKAIDYIRIGVTVFKKRNTVPQLPPQVRAHHPALLPLRPVCEMWRHSYPR